jgi:hypothetical protein
MLTTDNGGYQGFWRRLPECSPALGLSQALSDGIFLCKIRLAGSPVKVMAKYSS